METKCCLQCKKTLSITEFHRDSTRKDGFCPYCKKCKGERDREYYQKNKEKLSIYYKKRYKGYIERDRSLRLDVLKKINPELDCKKCGIDDVRVLVIDHIKNDGYKERKEMNYSSFYRKILKMSAE